MASSSVTVGSGDSLAIGGLDEDIQRHARLATAPFPPSMFVVGEVHDDLVKPRRELTFTAKIIHASINPHERILRHLRGVLVVAEFREGDIKGPLPVAQRQLVKRLFIAGPATLQQFAVAGRRLGIRLFDTLHAEKFPRLDDTSAIFVRALLHGLYELNSGLASRVIKSRTACLGALPS